MPGINPVFFNSDLAAAFGIKEAILLQNFEYWIEKNRANERHYYDGKYWTYNTISAYQEMFPFMSAKMIRSAINHLVDLGLIEKSNYNKKPYDRTNWYALTDKYYSIIPQGNIRFALEGEPIPKEYKIITFGKGAPQGENGEALEGEPLKGKIEPMPDEMREKFKKLLQNVEVR